MGRFVDWGKETASMRSMLVPARSFLRRAHFNKRIDESTV